MNDKLQNILIQKGLSNRQALIADLVSCGLSNKEIGFQLFITEKGVKTHLTNIYTKMNVKSRAQLIVWCLPLIDLSSPVYQTERKTQAELDGMSDGEMEEIISILAYEAKYFNTDNDRVNPYIDSVLKKERLSRGLMVRRNLDGVSEVGWLLQKMIGEVLTNGQAAV